jgi:DNA mismatch repair ATPase MutL
MKFEKLEKKISKLDNDIEALRRVKQYLSNKDEINEISDLLNQERQVYADELYLGDAIAYTECLDIIKNLLNKELGKEEQIKLLEDIKEMHGRKSPNVSKKSHGLNAWLKFLDVECEWNENIDEDWSTLIIKGFTLRNNQ